MPDLFDELYRKAYLADHPRLVMLQTLQHRLGNREGALSGIRQADNLLELNAEFDRRMKEAADRARIRMRRIDYICPICGLANCPAAQPMFHLPLHAQQLIGHLLAGGQSYQYDDDSGT
jgi:hypothetical protein